MTNSQDSRLLVLETKLLGNVKGAKSESNH